MTKPAFFMQFVTVVAQKSSIIRKFCINAPQASKPIELMKCRCYIDIS